MAEQLLATLLLSLRIAPALGYAAPFTLVRVPALIRILLGIALSATLVASFPDQTTAKAASENPFLAAVGEFAIGLSIALCLQLTFGAIYWAGRVLDIQAGFGLAMVADPTTQAQLPLAGTILGYTGAAVFFLSGLQYDLLALWAASVEFLPLGYVNPEFDLSVLLGFFAAIFSLSLGLVGISMMVIFMVDLAIAFMSRSLPQMNVLLLGFQVKSLVMLLTLPLSLIAAGAIFVRMFRMALETIPRSLSVG